MAFDINQVQLVGGITREPELRSAATGTSILNFSVAVNHSRKVDGEWVDEPNFIDVVAFGDLADNVSESLEKGNRVSVTGRLQQRSWEDKETGAKRSKIEVVAASVAVDLTRATAAVTRIKREDG